LDDDHLRAALSSVPRGAAAGGSGLVTDVLRQLALSAPDGLAMVKRVLLPVARGTLPNAVASAIGSSTLTGLVKPGSTKLRPIGVGEALRRTAARAVVRQLSERFRKHFAPLQYGVETKGGAQQVVMTLRGHMERAVADGEPVLLIRFDAKNAFNCLARKALFSQLRVHFPELLPGVCAFYVLDGVLHVRGGDGSVHKLCSVSGVTQGDVYGPVLFALGLHPTLIATMERFGRRGVYVLAFADDIHLVGPPEATTAAYLFMRSELRRACNLEPSAGKCFAYSPGGDYPAALFLESIPRPDGTDGDVKIMPDGFIVLGVPFHVGDRADAITSANLLSSLQDATAERSVASALHSLIDLAHHGGPHGRFGAAKLLQICVTGKVTYFSQLIPPAAAFAASEWAAEKMAEAWLAIIGGDAVNAEEMSSYGAWRKRLLALPISQGGAGLTSPAETGPLAFIGAHYAFLPACRERAALCAALWGCDASVPDRLFGQPCYPAPAPATQPAPPPCRPLLPFQSTLRSLSTSIASGLPAGAKLLDLNVKSGAQHDLQRQLTVAHYAALRPVLRECVRREECLTGLQGTTFLRFDAAAGYGYGAWQTRSAGARHHSLSAEELACSARRHLSLSFPALRQRAGGRAVACPLCKEPMDKLGAHVLACCKAGALDNACHDLVRDALYAACADAGFHPSKETPGLVEGTRERPADVLLAAGHGLGTQAQATLAACMDCNGVRVECASYRATGAERSLSDAHARKKGRVFKAPASALPVAEAEGERAAAASRAAGDPPAQWAAARDAAKQRALEARRPAVFVVPIVFSSCGGFHDGDPRLGLRAVMGALAARHKAGESGRAEGVGDAAVHGRWLPQLATAVERGVWRRFDRVLKELNGESSHTRLAASDLPSAVTARIFAAGFS
jgi:hypothetical protein